MTNSLRHQSDILQDRYGLRVAARLTQAADALPHDITERLKAARMQALGRRKLAEKALAGRVHAAGGSAVLGGGDDKTAWWSRVAYALPLVVLVIGLVAINVIRNEQAASDLAAVDSALLVDDLPPSAYADPGFVRFLQIRNKQAQ